MSKRYPSFEDITALERLTGGDYCARRGLLAYSVSGGKGITLRDVKSGREELISACGINESNPVFSPDGSALAFLAVKPGSGRQVFVCDMETREITQVSTTPGVAMDPVWSPDGQKIAFARVVDNSTAARGDEPIVIEDFGYTFDGRGYIRLDEHMQLYVADHAGGREKNGGGGEHDFLHHTWLPDSRHLVCESGLYRSKIEGLGYDLLKIDTVSGEITHLS